MLLRIIREVLGRIIVLIDWITRPSPVKRNTEDQALAQAATKGLALYQLYACPFCVKTRRAMHRLNIDLEIRDIRKTPMYRNELLKGGGQVKVPCLRIEAYGEVRWMYESNDIIEYLDNRVGQEIKALA